MATEDQAKALGFTVPDDDALVSDGALALRTDALATVDLAANRIVIGEDSYQASGSFGEVGSYSLTTANPVYYGTVNKARPFAAPAGWGFVPHVVSTGRYVTLAVTDATAATLQIRITQFASSSADTAMVIGWRLVPVA